MALRIGTFDNATGGNTLYKALTHPRAAQPARALLDSLADNAPVAIYDPDGAISAFAELFGLAEIEIAGVYVQQVERFGSQILGLAGRAGDGTRRFGCALGLRRRFRRRALDRPAGTVSAAGRRAFSASMRCASRPIG